MTDEAPPILATADLSPVSPSPLHPSSPVVVPVLQEQADHVDAMTPLQTVEAFPVLIQQSYEQVRPSASVDAQETIRATTSDIPPGDNNTTAGSETAEPVGEESDHKHAAQIQRSDQSTDSEQDQQEVVTSETNRVMPIADSQHLVDNAADVANAGPNVQGAATLAADGESATCQAAMDNTGPEDFNKQTVPTSERKATESPSGKPELEAVNISQTAKQSSMAIVPGLQGGAGISTASKPSSLPARPPVSVDTLPQVPQSLLTASPSTRGPLSESLAQLHGAQNRLEQGPYGWETFQLEERKYVADAKWDRFPDGSRLFIGNLSSERVSKREVFDVFSRFGRLAQISLKQAFGFVQYHTQQEGQAAMDNLQGTEIKGRKINLEFSRTQKRNDDGDRRGSRGKGDRRDGADTAKPRRDDYHPGREPSPHRRGSHRSHVSYPEPPRFDDGRYGSRGRSRSPGYGSHDLGSYRRRSPSPRRPHEAGPTLDIPRRYGSEVPDVQFLLLQEVEPNFVSWVQRAFADISLRIDVMFLNPQYPRDAVIQRQVLEGVHAVAELDFRAQQLGRIALQVFDRSAGRDQVRFDQYQDLEPHVAAQLVARARAQTAQYPAAYGGGHYPPAPQYSQPGPPTQPLHAYVGQQYPYQGPSTQPYGTVAPPPTHGPLDNASLQQILGTIQIQQGGPGQANGGHVDVNALLATLGNNASGPQGQHSQQHYAHPGHAGVAQPPHGGDSAQHVQNIMSQLARYRQ